ncbi:MAG TPA: Gldg family protein, partial [Myxococcaceae bacterium]|nr:Gldg family protein [Myxococcaceae bacterium]
MIAGKILGGVGLVLLLSSPYTLFITTGSPWLSALKALGGVALIGVYFATNYAQIGQFASRRSSFFIASTALMAIVAIAGLAAVNYVAAKKNKSWDLTSKKIYTLAPQTVSTLHGLKDKVRAIGFVQTSHPAYESLHELFDRYRREAPEKFDYVFKDPRKNPDLAAKYQLKEGQTTVVLTRGEGPQESHTALNVVSEQELTNALIKINSVGEQKVYFVVG